MTGEEYRTFCNKTVPLARFSKMVWLNNEVLEAPLEMAHFGAEPMRGAQVHWQVSTQDRQILAEETVTCDFPLGNCIPVGEIRAELSTLTQPTQLTVTAEVQGTEARNQWNLWVYPSEKNAVETMPYITTRIDATARKRLEQGGSVLLLTYGTVPPEKGGNITVGFSSIFWNTAWTRGQAPHTLGVCCDPQHPALAAFPNEGVSDYQWWDLMNRCEAMRMDDLPQELRPIVYLIDDWFTNRRLGMLFEARIGKGKILVCSADIQHDLSSRPAAAQFRQSLLEYMASDKFQPQTEININDLTYDNNEKK